MHAEKRDNLLIIDEGMDTFFAVWEGESDTFWRPSGHLCGDVEPKFGHLLNLPKISKFRVDEKMGGDLGRTPFRRRKGPLYSHSILFQKAGWFQMRRSSWCRNSFSRKCWLPKKGQSRSTFQKMAETFQHGTSVVRKTESETTGGDRVPPVVELDPCCNPGETQ